MKRSAFLWDRARRVICSNFTCSPPVRDADELARTLREQTRQQS